MALWRTLKEYIIQLVAIPDGKVTESDGQLYLRMKSFSEVVEDCLNAMTDVEQHLSKQFGINSGKHLEPIQVLISQLF